MDALLMLKFRKVKAVIEIVAEENVEEMIKEKEVTGVRAIFQTGVLAGVVTIHRDHDVSVQDLIREDQIQPDPGGPILNLIQLPRIHQDPDVAGDNKSSC